MIKSASESRVARDFERGLARAQKRVHRAVIRAQFAHAVAWACRAGAVVAGGYAALGVVMLLSGRAQPVGWAVFCLTAVGVMLITAAIPVVRAAVAPPSWRESAERLDLATADHNRIANGLALLDQADSPFARAAVADGWKTLERLHDRSPATTDLRASGTRPTWSAALCIVCGALGIALYAWPLNPLLDVASQGVTPTNVALTSAPIRNVAESPRKTPAPRPALRRERENAPSEAHNDAMIRGSATSRNQLSPGNPRPGNPGVSQSIDRPSAAIGDASGASSRGATRPREGGRQANPKRGKPAAERRQRPLTSAQSSSAVSGGTMGSSAASVIQHDWALREQAAEGDQEETEDDTPIEDERESNRQRGGVQPSLKDRAAAPSRDLGISGDQGPPGTGRGGPTPPKKSRGTASLVLGVPIPDFVRGRMGPGTTKTTHDRVDPVPRDGEPTKSVNTPRRTLPESPTRGELIPPAWRQIVRDYLVARHSADRIAMKNEKAKE